MEQTEDKKNDALEIRNYENAMLVGLEIIKKLPLNIFTVRTMHKTLLTGVRGKNKHPGEFRKGDAWIGQKGTQKGESRYIAPDAVHVPKLMEELTSFIENSGTVHPLIVCGIIHHRFEAIHPFEDGNGRTGRLATLLYLYQSGWDFKKILVLEDYYNRNRKAYYEALQTGRNYKERQEKDDGQGKGGNSK